MKNDNKSEFWNNIIRATEAEPREAKTLLGISGYSHPVIAVGVDEKRKRVVMISGEYEARFAALAQGDIQAAMPSVKVIMARPSAINLGPIAKVLSEIIGNVSIGPEEMKWLQENKEGVRERVEEIKCRIGDKISGFMTSHFSALNLNIIPTINEAIQQLLLIEVEPDNNKATETKAELPIFNVQKLAVLDPAEADRLMGVCSIPLYDIEKEYVEALNLKPDVDLAKELLCKHNILQYFFPAADHLALGLVDNSKKLTSTLMEQLIRTPVEGHPYGELEIIKGSSNLQDVVDALKDKGYLVEGEFGVEVTNEGQSLRSQVRFKPREGLINKLSKIFSLKVDISLKDFFK